MRLGSIRAGDMIRAGAMHAIVLQRLPGELVVKGLCNGATRRVKAGDIEVIWRRRPR